MCPAPRPTIFAFVDCPPLASGHSRAGPPRCSLLRLGGWATFSSTRGLRRGQRAPRAPPAWQWHIGLIFVGRRLWPNCFFGTAHEANGNSSGLSSQESCVCTRGGFDHAPYTSRLSTSYSSLTNISPAHWQDVAELLSPSRGSSRAEASQVPSPSRATSRATAPMAMNLGLPLDAVPEEASYTTRPASEFFFPPHDAASHNPPPLPSAAASATRVPVAGRRSRAGAYAGAASSSSTTTGAQVPNGVDPILPLLLARSASKHHYHSGPPPPEHHGALVVHGAAPPPPPAGGQVSNRGRASSRVTSNQQEPASHALAAIQPRPPKQAASSAASSISAMQAAPLERDTEYWGALVVAEPRGGGVGGGGGLTGARDDLRPIASSSGASNGPVRWTHGSGDGGGDRRGEQYTVNGAREARIGDASRSLGSSRWAADSSPDEAPVRVSGAGGWRSAKPGQIDTGTSVSPPLDDVLEEHSALDDAGY